MVFSRLRRYSERQQKKRLTLSLVGIAVLVTFISLFGVKILIGFSLLVDKLRGGTPSTPPATVQIILPPVLDPLPDATNSSTLTISGKGQSGLTIILYQNEEEYMKFKVSKDGIFRVSSVPLKEGKNIFSAKLSDQKGITSDLSNIIIVVMNNNPPLLDISEPIEGAIVRGEKNIVALQGRTEEEVSVTVNGRFVVLTNDNSFLYDYPLNEGSNTLSIVATDVAGNQTIIDRHVTYQK